MFVLQAYFIIYRKIIILNSIKIFQYTYILNKIFIPKGNLEI